MSSLGIDAAWTPRAASGIAVLDRGRTRWTFHSARTGFAPFLPESDHDHQVVAIDMPLAHTPITKRRFADNEVSRQFGKHKAGVHSPTPDRPGSYGDSLKALFVQRGYRLATAGAQPRKAMIEVFPLAALVRLMRLHVRPMYKVAKSGRYWAGATRDVRMQNLRDVWRRIEETLHGELDGLPVDLVPESFLDMTIRELKAYEDRIDGIICALVGALYLDGRAEPLGDADSAIWVPRAQYCDRRDFGTYSR